VKNTKSSKNVSDTPETDAAALHDGTVVSVDVARKLERERDELRADQINHENLSMRYMDERDEAREAFAVATSNCVDAQQQLRTARNLADAAMWEADRLRSKLEKLERERDELREDQSNQEDILLRYMDEVDEAREELSRYKRQWDEARSENVEDVKQN